MTDLPTRAALLDAAADALFEARDRLSDARDWLNSDWTPSGTPLTRAGADARQHTLALIADTKARLDDAVHELRGAAVTVQSSAHSART